MDLLAHGAKIGFYPGIPARPNIRTLGKHPGKKHKNVAKSFLFLCPGEKPAGGRNKSFVLSDFMPKFAGFFAGRSREV
jgi:hypothetical protein